MKSENNLKIAQLDSETLELLLTLFRLYDIAKLNSNIYKKDEGTNISKYLIQEYYKHVKPNYNNMIYSFRRKYISNELLVEKNDSPEERAGMKLVYDFIQNFDTEKNYFNIFTTSMVIHGLLYKPLDIKFEEERKKIIEEARILEQEAKAEKNLDKLKQAREMLKAQQHASFGGNLRTSNVLMKSFNVEVPPSDEVMILFNQFLTPEKIAEYENKLANADLIEYIDYAVNTTADLIGMQPFSDGNKRTFRSLLNLMFKKKNLPPVYIVKKERKAYHEALEKAISDHNYEDLDAFYYYKICNSIYELDFVPILNNKANDNNSLGPKKQ